MATKRLNPFGAALLGGLLLLWPCASKADEPQHLRQSVRALGMGNAFVAAVNDENSLYYNPAGLASVQRSFFELLSVNLTVNQNLIDLAQTDSADQTAAIGNIVGNKLYAEEGIGLLSFTAPYWGWSFYENAVFDAQVHNPTIPYFDALVYGQVTAIGGFAFSLWDQQLDIGTSLKYVYRKGIGKTIHIVDALDPKFSDNLQNELVDKSQVAPDVGVTYHYDRWYNFQLKASAVMKNIGGMDFGSSGSFPTTVDLGLASESEVLGFDLLMAADLVDSTFQATEKKSLARNINLGAELGMWKRSNGGHHFLAFRAGKKGPYPTVGFSFNPPLLPIMIDYALWSEEVGAVAGAKEDKRTSLQISFNF